MKKVLLGLICGIGLFGASSCSQNEAIDPSTEVYVIDSIVDPANGLDLTKTTQ